MIELTRLNGSALSVNCDLIRYVEATPDTTLTMVTGEKLMVREAREDVAWRVLQHRAEVLRTAWPSAETALTGSVAFRESER
ncbi:MAG: flagellar FlbD family protein [Acidobacteria bacterium]|nr:flagellar FlbD family protein [Acidobacteriota bacterium]